MSDNVINLTITVNDTPVNFEFSKYDQAVTILKFVGSMRNDKDVFNAFIETAALQAFGAPTGSSDQEKISDTVVMVISADEINDKATLTISGYSDLTSLVVSLFQFETEAVFRELLQLLVNTGDFGLLQLLDDAGV